MAQADLIITNAAVYTVDPVRPTAEAVAITGNRISFVGSTADAMALRANGTRVVDGNGATVLPGINDSHFHLLMGALRLDHLDLAAVKTLDELRIALHRGPEEGWIQGFGLAYDVVGAGVPLTRQHLDELVGDRPVLLFSMDFHTCWANTRAFEIAGILHGGQAKPGGEIVMADDGTAAGQINEDSGVIGRHIPDPTAAETRVLVQRTVAQLNAYGITSVINMDGTADQMALYASLAAEDKFNLRIQMPYSITPKTSVDAIVDEAIPLIQKYHSGKVRAGSVKLFIDGVVESATAFVLEPYARWPDKSGFPLYEWDHYRDLIVEADRHKLQVKVHAIGDAGVRMTLDAYEAARAANGARDSRHRIEHVELLHDEDLPRFAQLGVIAAMQPIHASRPAVGHYVNWMNCVGEERYHRAFRWRELRQQGVPLPFGSDWPVVTFDPYEGMYAAVSQTAWQPTLPNQAQTLAEAVAGYTHVGAYSEFQEHEKGQIKEGMLADLLLLDQNLFTVGQADIREVRPAMTICDGKVVYEA